MYVHMYILYKVLLKKKHLSFLTYDKRQKKVTLNKIPIKHIIVSKH